MAGLREDHVRNFGWLFLGGSLRDKRNWEKKILKTPQKKNGKKKKAKNYIVGRIEGGEQEKRN